MPPAWAMAMVMADGYGDATRKTLSFFNPARCHMAFRMQGRMDCVIELDLTA